MPVRGCFDQVSHHHFRTSGTTASFQLATWNHRLIPRLPPLYSGGVLLRWHSLNGAAPPANGWPAAGAYAKKQSSRYHLRNAGRDSLSNDSRARRRLKICTNQSCHQGLPCRFKVRRPINLMSVWMLVLACFPSFMPSTLPRHYHCRLPELVGSYIEYYAVKTKPNVGGTVRLETTDQFASELIDLA